jgi:hypothetical protein
MADEWIKVRLDLESDPKVVTLSSLVERDTIGTLGALVSFWSVADRHAIIDGKDKNADGFLRGYTLGEIDRRTGTPGFGAALESIGWVEETPEGLVLKRFAQHNGKSTKTRLRWREKQQRKRASPDVSPAKGDTKGTGRSSRGGTVEEEGEREEEREKKNPPPKPPPAGTGKSGPTVDGWVNRIYAAYPRKEKPRDARKAIEAAARRHHKSGRFPALAHAFAFLEQRATDFRRSPRGQKPTIGKDYRPYPATWFNADGFDEPDDAWQRPNGDVCDKPPGESADDVADRVLGRTT